MTRIATVDYLNAAPLTDRLDRARYDVVSDHPAAISELLHRGEVDVALVPVAAVLRDPELRIVPGYCIGAAGPVTSVLLVAEVPPAQWEHLVLDGESRSSAALARLLLDGPLAEVSATVEDGAPGTAVERARGSTAALVIGDAARDLPDRLTTRIDLAELWHGWIGLPFVFAVWAGRAGLPAAVVADLRAAGREGLASLEDSHRGADLAYLRDSLRYHLDDRALMGLRRFAALGHAAGLFATRDVVLYGPEPAAVAAPHPALVAAAAGERIDASTAGAFLVDGVSELALAADVRRKALHADITYTTEHSTLPMVEVNDTLIAQLTALRQRQDAGADVAGVRVELPEGRRVDAGETASDLVRAVAVARLFLDNVPHLVVPWVSHGEALTQAALHAGCNDVGTIAEGDPRLAELKRSVRGAGFAPVRRTAPANR